MQKEPIPPEKRKCDQCAGSVLFWTSRRLEDLYYCPRCLSSYTWNREKKTLRSYKLTWDKVPHG